MFLQKTKKTLRGAGLWVEIRTQDLPYKEVRVFTLEEDTLWRFTPCSHYNSVDNFQISPCVLYVPPINSPNSIGLIILASLRDGRSGVPAREEARFSGPRSTHLPIQWVPGVLSTGWRRRRRDADQPPPSSAVVEYGYSYTSASRQCLLTHNGTPSFVNC